jgi:GMP synthase (glutamine-hydrolysing)
MREEIALLAELTAAGRPVLGVCLGAQLLARAGGGDTEAMAEPEIGWYDVVLSAAGAADPLLAPLAPSFASLQWHSCALSPPTQAARLAASQRCAQAFRSGERAWGIQFHAEVTLADFESWIDGHLATGEIDGPPDAEGFRAATRDHIVGWNSLGRDLFARFLAQAATA